MLGIFNTVIRTATRMQTQNQPYKSEHRQRWKAPSRKELQEELRYLLLRPRL